MKNYKLQISEGFRDIYGSEMLLKEKVESIILKEFSLFGYEHVKTPTVEYIDVYSDKGLQKPDLYSLINRQGEVLALCNDMTASIARFASQAAELKTARYSYMADTFRYPRLYQGKNHEFTQAGVELVGQSSIDADVEAIYLSYKTLKACGLKNFTIHLGSAKFVEELLDDFKVSNKEEIFKAIEAHDYVLLKNLLESSIGKVNGEYVLSIIIRGGRLNYIENLMKALNGKKCLVHLEYLHNLYNKLKALGIESILFDFSIYSYAEYYTGVIFNVYAEGFGKELVSGGRADNLFKDFGRDYGDIGFGLDVDSLVSYCLDHNLLSVESLVYVSYVKSGNVEDAFKMLEDFRNKGIIVFHSFSVSLEDAKILAKEKNAKNILVFENNKFSLVEVQ